MTALISARERFVDAYSDALRAYTKMGIYQWMGITFSVWTLYPDPCLRTKEHLLGGLTNVTRFEFLQGLPGSDPRKKELKTIVYPGPERRALLEKNLEAMDEYLVALSGIQTRTVFETVARLGLDENNIFGDDKMDFSELESIVHNIDKNKNEIIEGAYETELRVFDLLLRYLHSRLNVRFWYKVDPDTVWGTRSRGYA